MWPASNSFWVRTSSTTFFLSARSFSNPATSTFLNPLASFFSAEGFFSSLASAAPAIVATLRLKRRAITVFLSFIVRSFAFYAIQVLERIRFTGVSIHQTAGVGDNFDEEIGRASCRERV